MTEHQNKQLEVIAKIEDQVKNNSISFSTVSQVENFENDTRMCLTSAHLPHQNLKDQILSEITAPLRNISSEHYYFPEDSLHMTIKNIKVVNDPPNFTEKDITKSEKVFSNVIPRHKKFQVYFYRLFLFPMNLALFGTTDPELDEIIFDLDRGLKNVGITDDKKFVNEKYFFSNMTIARFTEPVSDSFVKKILELSDNTHFLPYFVDSVSLVTCNGSFRKKKIINTWELNNN